MGGTQAKYYLSDPILAWLPSSLRFRLGMSDLTALTEAAIGTTLALALENQQEGRLASGDTIGYLRTDSGKEVDLCPVAVATAGGTGTTTPIESKWVARGWRAEAKVIEGKYQGGVLATRNILDLSERVGSPSAADCAPVALRLWKPRSLRRGRSVRSRPGRAVTTRSGANPAHASCGQGSTLSSPPSAGDVLLLRRWRPR